MSQKNVHQWFDSSLGQYLIEHEHRYFDQVVVNIFGYNAVQIGWPQFNFLNLNRMPLHFSVATRQINPSCQLCLSIL